ncbi:MAG: primosomal protein N' [Candidatus Peribacteraceae bacterium]|nr:primosomal protein N' [Candidatus Peribacteraceae bacterium]
MRWTVLTASKSSGIGEGLTYEGDADASPGSYVRIPLRRRMVDGILLGRAQQKEKEAFAILKIESVLGDRPLLTEPQMKTLEWMASYYHCSLRQALQAWLPSPPWATLLPQKILHVTLLKPEEPVRGTRQRDVLDLLSSKGSMPLAALQEEAGVSRAVINGLKKRGIIEMTEIAESAQEIPPPVVSPPTLTPAQMLVHAEMRGDRRPTLLFGVTGSGKTEVYAALIADTVAQGKRAILLVPEILLTEHCIHRFQRLLGEEHVAVWHSRLTGAQRRATWRRIHSGEVSLVIGSRSALFTPLQNLGLVILDEEHEWTYKNEQTPRYHARETAETLCRHAGAKLVLGSATPSLESWARAKEGRYHLVRLPERYLSQAFPVVRIVDLAQAQCGSLYPLSPSLLAAIEERLQKQEQSILFLNHRGIASALLCLDCRRRVVSPDSRLPFTVHRAPGNALKLVDHTTGLTLPVPTVCPACGSVRLHCIGAGTQKVETLLRQRFPEARLLRADSDTLQHPEQMRQLLASMRERRADILLGTQSVVKGLDLPQVTLAAVLLADIGLSLPHFRAGERIFQLLSQLTGRSGRSKPGEVIIQTYRPDAPEVLLAAGHNAEKFLDDELALRIHAGYPPAAKLIRLLLRGSSAQQRAMVLSTRLKQAAESQQLSLTISSAATIFGGGKVWHILIRGTKPEELLRHVDVQDAVVDVDPVECV